MGFSRAYDRFLDLLEQVLPQASDTTDKRRTKRKEQTQAFAVEGTTCGISRSPLLTREELENSFAARPPARKSYVRKSEWSKEIGIEAWKDIEFSSRASVVARSRINKGSFSSLSSFTTAVVVTATRNVVCFTVFLLRWRRKMKQQEIPLK